MGHLNELGQKAFQNSINKGQWTHDPDAVVPHEVWSEKIALIHSEVSEMLDALRDGNEPLLALECADVIIRVGNFAASRGIDLDLAVEEKMAYNETRPHLHNRLF